MQQRKGGYSWIGMIAIIHHDVSVEELIELYERYLAALTNAGYDEIVGYMNKGLELTKEERTILLQIIQEESKK